MRVTQQGVESQQIKRQPNSQATMYYIYIYTHAAYAVSNASWRFIPRIGTLHSALKTTWFIDPPDPPTLHFNISLLTLLGSSYPPNGWGHPLSNDRIPVPAAHGFPEFFCIPIGHFIHGGGEPATADPTGPSKTLRANMDFHAGIQPTAGPQKNRGSSKPH